MKAITRYQSDDNFLFNTEAECLKHEMLLSNINACMSILPKKPDTTDFTNGNGYIQHNKEDWEEAKATVLIMVKEKYPDTPIKNGLDAISYYLQGGIFSAAIERFICTDSKFREWGQRYVARNPDRGVHIQLND